MTRRFWKNLPKCDRTASCHHVRLLNDKFLSLVLHDLVEGVEATKMLGLTLREVSSHLGKGEDGDEGNRNNQPRQIQLNHLLIVEVEHGIIVDQVLPH